MRFRSKGFTLIEILVTLVILTVILSLLYSVLVSMIGAKQRIESKSTQQKVRTNILLLLSQDIHGVYTYSVGEPAPVDPSEEASDVDLPRIEDSFVAKDGGDIDSLSFLSSRDFPGTEDDPPSDFTRIHYALQPSEEEGLYTLFRGIQPYLPAEEEEGGEALYVEVYDRITVFDLQYFDGEEWSDTWTDPAPPMAIRLILNFRLEGDDPYGEPYPTFEVSLSVPTS
jgi:prepilin-type N-terminal cleavage/methylation domain-containing protein